MVRTRTFKRRSKRTMRRGRRKFNISRPMVSRQPILNVKRTFYGGNWTFSTATTNGFWRYFTYDMTTFQNFAEMASVFDEYKVNAMKVTFRPAYDNTTNVQTAATTLGQVQAYAHVVVDPASTLVPSGVYSSANLNTFLENDSLRTKTLNRPFSVYYKPKVTDQVFNTGTAAVMRKPAWTRTTETGQQFRGFHMFLQQNNMSTVNANINLDVFITFYVQFRNLR